MADKTGNDDVQSFQLYENGPRVSASGSLADALQKKGNAGYVAGDTRRSDQITTLDSLGVARTTEFEQQFANKRGGGRVPGSERLRGDAVPEDASTDGGPDYVGTVGASSSGEVVEVRDSEVPVADQPVGAKSTARKNTSK